MSQVKTTRKLLAIDTAFSYEAICARKLQESITSRDLDGFFDHVWSVHPFASLVEDDESRKFGRPDIYSIADRHTFINGKVGRFKLLAAFQTLNFAISQAGICLSLLVLIFRQKISVVRAGDPLYLGLCGLILSRMAGVPLVVRIGANYDKIYETTGQPIMPRLFRSLRLERKITRFVLKRADLVAAVNCDNLEFAVANGARRSRSTIFRYGNLIDRRHFSEPASRHCGPELLLEFQVVSGGFLLHVGRLESVKFPEDVIHVFADVRSRGHDVKLLMVGDGQLRERLEHLVEELAIEEYVVFCGNRDQDWLSQVIPLAAVVISPCTGRALSEVALGAAPVVAYDVDWQGELIENEITGRLVAHLDRAKMADAVDKLLGSPDHARLLGNALRQRALQMMDVEVLNEHERTEYLAVFDRDSLHGRNKTAA